MSNRKFFRIIIGVSVVLVGAVAFLYFKKPDGKVDKESILFLPAFHAILNFSTAICLVLGAIAMKWKQNQALHSKFMMTAFALSTLFLVSYIVYHYLAPSTKYGGEGVLKNIYLFILLTHILLAIVVLPLVLLSFYYALSKQFNKHKKMVKWTLPIWLYVAITGVIVYFMIKPYY